MIPKSHPRYKSLKTRDLIVKGVEEGVTSMHGLIAQGRGESFDYLLREKTNDFAIKSIEAAASMLLLSKHPVISVNGNVAALVPNEIVKLSKLLDAPIEVNLFHSSKKRELKIKKYLENFGAKKILLPQKKCQIRYLESNRKYVNPEGIMKADVVFVPLEDGDRAEALIKNGKKVITIDLNPLSRTAQKSTIAIVDNITRALPLLIKITMSQKKLSAIKLKKIIKSYNNIVNLKLAAKKIRK